MYFELQPESVSTFLSQDFTAVPFCAAVQSFVARWFSQAPLLQRSSGSTGKPKEFQLDRAAMRASARMSCSYFDLQAGDTALLCLSVEYIAGKMMVVRALEGGVRLLLIPPRAKPLAELDEVVDFAAVVPAQLQAALPHLDRVRKLIVGGASPPPGLVAALQGKSTRCWATYGMTETLSHVAVKPLNFGSPRAAYRALPGIRFSCDLRSCLVVDAPALGIHQLVTNDVVERISEVAFRWLGRIDHVINSGGIKIFPEQVEARLSPYFSKRFFLGKQRDPKWGERLVLLLESAPFALQKSDFQRMGLAPHEVPKRVYFLSRFAETPTGKIQRAQTLARLEKEALSGFELGA